MYSCSCLLVTLAVLIQSLPDASSQGTGSMAAHPTPGNSSADTEDFHGYLIPYLTGLGVNNQLWEYTANAVVAKVTQRKLCLVPFLRFYLDTSGQPTIPFEALFDVEMFSNFTSVAPLRECVKACKGKFTDFYLVGRGKLPSSPKVMINPPAFLKNTGFVRIPPKQLMIDSGALAKKTKVNELTDFLKGKIRRASRCVGMLLNPHAVGVEEMKKTADQHYVSSPSIMQAAKNAVDILFQGQPYIAIHWRFEESKCRGIGNYLPDGRSRPKNFDISSLGHMTVGKGDLCFLLVIKDKALYLLATENDIVTAVKQLMDGTGIRNVFLATDVDPKIGGKLITGIKAKTNMKQISDVMDQNTDSGNRWFGENNLEQRDVLSRIEQEICVEATRFLGTSRSSWTDTVLKSRASQGKADQAIGYGQFDLLVHHVAT